MSKKVEYTHEYNFPSMKHILHKKVTVVTIVGEYDSEEELQKAWAADEHKEASTDGVP